MRVDIRTILRNCRSSIVSITYENMLWGCGTCGNSGVSSGTSGNGGVPQVAELSLVGANSEEEVGESLSIVSETLRELGIEVTETPPIEIQNIVASVDFGTQFNLNAIAIGLGLEDVEYEPEQFPGLVYRLEDPSAVALLFGSGRAVITGAKTTDAVAHTTNAVETRLTDLGLFQ
ncbi:hypothetical protein [Halostagnicola sp. A56]|uniref:hypothetical protein n=1 Tax=Halostagnicola sp. A56 TaxID=1495067 RepID=UPI001E3F5D72|nr:hypothetical protein [Halostagnicola sp. A56]